MFVIEEHIVPDGIAKIRLSDYAVGLFRSVHSRKGIKKAIKAGRVTVNGKKASTAHWVEAGQMIALLEEKKKSFTPLPLKLNVVFEDEHLAVVFKPGGLVVSGNQFRTLENALPNNVTPATGPDSLMPPRCVHRLDGPTCGLVLVAKTAKARVDLGRQFESKTVKKHYRAVVMGKLEGEGRFDTSIGNKKALTKFRVIDAVPSLRSGTLTLVELTPVTGRTHQLRIHLSEAGLPILGDEQYGKKGEVFKGKGLFLCAVELRFDHPVTGRPVRIVTDMPNKFRLQMEREERRWNKFRLKSLE